MRQRERKKKNLSKKIKCKSKIKPKTRQIFKQARRGKPNHRIIKVSIHREKG
jgi:hypothetical protein